MKRGSPLLLVLGLMLCVAASVAGYVHAQPDSYSSTAVLTLDPRDPVEVGSDDLTLAAARYVAYLGAPETQAQVASALGDPVQRVTGETTVVQQPATVNLRIQVVGTSPEDGAAIANALAVAGVRESVGDDQVVASVIVPAVVPVAPSGPPRRLLILLGGVGSLCLGLLAVLALGYLRPEFRVSANYRPATA